MPSVDDQMIQIPRGRLWQWIAAIATAYATLLSVVMGAVFFTISTLQEADAQFRKELNEQAEKIAALQESARARKTIEALVIPLLHDQDDRLSSLEVSRARFACKIDPECWLTPREIFDAVERARREREENPGVPAIDAPVEEYIPPLE